MGRDPKHRCLMAITKMHEVANVFITDGSCMATSVCQNPSVTFYMALTARGCDFAVNELKKAIFRLLICDARYCQRPALDGTQASDTTMLNVQITAG